MIDEPSSSQLSERELEVLQMVAEGLPLFGYLHWTFCDNYEWGYHAPRFGLFATDYDHNSRRKPLDASGCNAAGTYGALAKAMRSRDNAQIRDAFLAKEHPLVSLDG